MISVTSTTRRALLAQGLRLAVLGLLPPGFVQPLRAQAGGAGVATAALTPSAATSGGTSLVLLGTHGGPGIDLARAQTASAVVVDGRPYLVDCGYGAVRQLVASNVGYLDIGNIFFTHLHDDHTADLPALLSFQWTNGRVGQTDAYGPYGTEQLVDAAIASFRNNVQIRSVDEGRGNRPELMYHGHDVVVTATPAQIFKDDRITVTAVENAHFPERSTARIPHRSLALRFDTKRRSIVFSGDTAYSANIVRLARGADVFVCEVIADSVYAQMVELAKTAAANGNAESIYRHVAETHSPPEVVGRMAAEAGVGTVVLYHQVAGTPAANGLAYPVSQFIGGVRRHYAGEVIVGQDLMVL